MNITDVFFNNSGQLNWDAISTISNFILVASLVIITLWNVIQVKKQTGFMKIERIVNKIERLVNEMDKLVAPLHSEIGNNIIFQKGAQSNIDSRIPRDQKYLWFWDGIKNNKYLGPHYLRLAIDDYLENKSNTVGDKTRDALYEKAEANLFIAIHIRYSEIEYELSVLRKKT